jgi:hypothetical protein
MVVPDPLDGLGVAPACDVPEPEVVPNRGLVRRQGVGWAGEERENKRSAPVNTWVNNPANDSPERIAPLA